MDLGYARIEDYGVWIFNNERSRVNLEEVKVEINRAIKERLPNTYEILINSGLMIHPYVYKVVLTGSRGLAGSYRGDSDIDLSG